jgi:molybdenum cofactor cytidylyltransferase
VIAAVVLAAGTSSRLGRPKQLLTLGDKTVIEHVVDRVAASSVDQVMVVLGHAADEIRAVLTGRDVRYVINASYRDGQGTSLVAGIREAEEAGADAVVMVLGDQPTIRPVTIDALIARHRESAASIVMATYGGQRSHPVFFDRSLFPELLRVEGDQGARGVIRRHRDDVGEVDSGEPDLPNDIDTEAAYQEMVSRWADYESNAP